MPGHLTSFKVGGHFGAKGSSLNDRGAGDRLRRFNYASESPRSGTRSHHRHTESCKPNKTKQNKTVTQAAVAGILSEATATSRPGALRAAGRAVNLEPSTQSQSHKRPEVEIWRALAQSPTERNPLSLMGGLSQQAVLRSRPRSGSPLYLSLIHI